MKIKIKQIAYSDDLKKLVKSEIKASGMFKVHLAKSLGIDYNCFMYTYNTNKHIEVSKLESLFKLLGKSVRFIVIDGSVNIKIDTL